MTILQDAVQYSDEYYQPTEYIYPDGSSASSPTLSGKWRRHRDAIRRGDTKSPLPWYHARVSSSGRQTASSHISYWYSPEWGVYIRKYKTTTQSGPFVQEQQDNQFWNSSQIGMILPGDYSLSNMTALERLNQSKMDIAVTIGEALQTSRHLADRGRDLISALLSFKRGRWSKALGKLNIGRKGFNLKARTKSASDLWLEYNLAVRPLLSDIDSLAQLAAFQMSDLPVIHVSASAGVKSDIDTMDTTFYQDNMSDQTVTKGYIGKEFVKTKYFATVNDIEVIAGKALGLSHAAPALWELVPFSFVVDYAVQIGDYLRAWQGKKGLTFHSGYNSRKLDLTYSYHAIYDGSKRHGISSYEMYNRKSTSAFQGYRRDILYDWPPLELQYEFPDLRKLSIVAALVASLKLPESPRRMRRFR